ncbi:MAG: bifunctional DNA-formamidopyrimidine glycosylase/DNA-(apurinic or apyrimidinic site) lyase [Betaproteobacteria bacterium]|nr:bifunctional DNA-formamidopyrimidine glycosylase/DNA-(apurinic or apyrimidinic site) lyase [Betaproteobacteria bacterium]
MPELPEVEVTRRGIAPHVEGRVITGLVVRNHALRWPVDPTLPKVLKGLRIARTQRRAKYLLLDCGRGWLIIHLGMSGSLSVLNRGAPPRLHDHIDLELDSGELLRLHDPRRFGAFLWTQALPAEHELIAHLGPEPFDAQVTGTWLRAQLKGRKAPVKNLLMDTRLIVGVGNIYASEALFHARVRPGRAGGRVTLAECHRLIAAIQATLAKAIEAGGSTLRDFVGADGSSGYFQQTHFVYDRAGAPCRVCGHAIKLARFSQRSTYYCSYCQQ